VQRGPNVVDEEGLQLRDDKDWVEQPLTIACFTRSRSTNHNQSRSINYFQPLIFNITHNQPLESTTFSSEILTHYSVAVDLAWLLQPESDPNRILAILK
jgi:hypothetical protein